MSKKLIIDNPTISSVVFYPRRTRIPEDLPSNIKALKFQIDKDIMVGGFFFLNDKSLPTILLFHGNGEVALEYSYFNDLFFECGVNLACVDFRGYGHSTGEPIYSSLITDAFPIYERFKEWMDTNNMINSLFVQGRSLGSVCAAEIGSHNPDDLKGVIFESGFASVYNMMTKLFRVDGPEITEEFLHDLSNDTRVKQFEKPTLIIHGTMDWIIPKEEGELLYESLPKGVAKKLVMIEGAGHNNIFSFKNEYFSPLKDFIQKFK
jgi:pimeloyl-ACP methyl ester carboxylesterase